MNTTTPDNLIRWINELENGSTESFSCPSFLKPFHLITLGLAVKRAGWSNLQLPEELQNYAVRMKLWDSVGMEPPYNVREKPSTGKFLPLQSFTKNQRPAAYTANQLVEIAVKKAPQEYADSLAASLEELINNFFDHSDSKNEFPCLVCAQSWPQGNLVQIAMADAGVGIRTSLSTTQDQALREKLKTANACKLASEYGTSSKLGRGHAGYGLTLAKDLMKQARGSYILLSGNELFASSDSQEITKEFTGTWQGTLIVLELRIDVPLSTTAVYKSWPHIEGYTDEDFF